MAEGDRIVMGLFGGLILGFWIYGLLFKYDNGWEALPWFGWGAVGLAMAGGIYAARAVAPNVRVLLVTLIGVLTTITVTFAIANADLYGLATIVTLVGAGLVASAIEPPARDAEPSGAEAAPGQDRPA